MPEDKIPPGNKCCLMLQLVSIHDTVPEGPLMHGLTSSFKYPLFFFSHFSSRDLPSRDKSYFFKKKWSCLPPFPVSPDRMRPHKAWCTTPGKRLSSEHLLSCCKWKLRDSREHERGAEESASSQQWRARRKIYVYVYYKVLLNQTWKWAEADWERTNFRQNPPIRSLNSAPNATD